MFNLSGSEIVFLLLMGLVVLGPDRLPDAMRRAGKAYAEFKKMSTGFQSEMRSALDEPLRELRETADLAKNAAMFDFTAGANSASTAATPVVPKPGEQKPAGDLTVTTVVPSSAPPTNSAAQPDAAELANEAVERERIKAEKRASGPKFASAAPRPTHTTSKPTSPSALLAPPCGPPNAPPFAPPTVSPLNPPAAESVVVPGDLTALGADATQVHTE